MGVINDVEGAYVDIQNEECVLDTLEFLRAEIENRRGYKFNSMCHIIIKAMDEMEAIR